MGVVSSGGIRRYPIGYLRLSTVAQVAGPCRRLGSNPGVYAQKNLARIGSLPVPRRGDGEQQKESSQQPAAGRADRIVTARVAGKSTKPRKRQKDNGHNSTLV